MLGCRTVAKRRHSTFRLALAPHWHFTSCRLFLHKLPAGVTEGADRADGMFLERVGVSGGACPTIDVFTSPKYSAGAGVGCRILAVHCFYAEGNF